ncbi:MAG: hypothetical protein KI790_13455 [Cyclobacteriaceae bacterium]|nr:hypothetical protein [Cyclobacteriaceae bacterium HetDA_MAG_MS6]
MKWKSRNKAPSIFRNWLLIVMIVLQMGCNESEQPGANDLGLDYYPSATGRFQTFDVTTITYEISGFDTSHYQLREVISDSIVAGEDVTYILARETRSDEGQPWTLQEQWSFRKNERFVAVTENNQPFVKLSFPIVQGKSWDGNSLNALSQDDYLFEQAEINPSSFQIALSEDLVQVTISDIEANIVNQDQRYEIYGKGIGLIEKNYLILNFCTVDCDSAGQIESGSFLSQRLVDYGSL